MLDIRRVSVNGFVARLLALAGIGTPYEWRVTCPVSSADVIIPLCLA